MVDMHGKAAEDVTGRVPPSLSYGFQEAWKECLASGRQYGYRNAQVTLLAPTGTIAFMMDCDTTGIEPDLALVKYKKLVGGGVIRMVNNVVRAALGRLGYGEQQSSDIVDYVERNGTIEGAPHLKPEHLPVFDCSLKPANGQRSIQPMAHVGMMAAVQPFLSGAISKTVNLPSDATVEEIADVYLESWRKGLKAIAVYRDASKQAQPLNTGQVKKRKEVEVSAETTKAPRQEEGEAKVPTTQPMRRRLPDERQALTHHFSVGGYEGYLMVGFYEDGQPGELFIRMAKAGSTIAGLMDSFGIAVSLALQFGVPLQAMCSKFSHTRFEPSGWSGVKEIGYAQSLMDYIFRWLAMKFLPAAEDEGVAESVTSKPVPDQGQPKPFEFVQAGPNGDGPACCECGAIMVRNGSCYRCLNCGGTSGCS